MINEFILRYNDDNQIEDMVLPYELVNHISMFLNNKDWKTLSIISKEINSILSLQIPERKAKRYIQDRLNKYTDEKYIDRASKNGDLDSVKWFHDNYTNECTDYAMDLASRGGYIDIVKFLHIYRTEGCTVYAMDVAAQYGHFKIVKYLDKIGKKCTTNAMDLAFRRHNYEIVIWLYKNRTEGFTLDELQLFMVDNNITCDHHPDFNDYL
jgi:hypothetical protein